MPARRFRKIILSPLHSVLLSSPSSLPPPRLVLGRSFCQFKVRVPCLRLRLVGREAQRSFSGYGGRLKNTAMRDLGDKVKLPCGLVLPNRQVKAPMSECMADTKKGNLVPTESMYGLYRGWAKGGFGMIITGNVMVDSRYFASPEDLTTSPEILTSPSHLSAWQTLAQTAQSHGTPAILQLNHPGRQSALGSGKRSFMEKTIAPSAVPLDFGQGVLARLMRAAVFGTPREMGEEDIEAVVEGFVGGARVAKEAGFKGVEVHAAHGYLLAQFLNPKTNKRMDAYGGTPSKRAHLAVRVIRAIRAATGLDFAIGIKLNSTDYQHAGKKGEEELTEQVKCILSAGVDFMEISGGNFENPQFFTQAPTPTSPLPTLTQSTALRESYFLAFTGSIRAAVPPASGVPLMVTGGFRTRAGMAAAVRDEACELVGLARVAVLEPGVVKERILNGGVEGQKAGVCVPVERAGGVLRWLGLGSLVSGKVLSTYGAKMRVLAKENAVGGGS